METSIDMDEVVDLIVSDEKLFKYVLKIVKHRLPAKVRKDPDWCIKVIDLTIEHVLKEVHVTDIVQSILKSYQSQLIQPELKNGHFENPQSQSFRPAFSSSEPVQVLDNSPKKVVKAMNRNKSLPSGEHSEPSFEILPQGPLTIQVENRQEFSFGPSDVGDMTQDVSRNESEASTVQMVVNSMNNNHDGIEESKSTGGSIKSSKHSSSSNNEYGGHINNTWWSPDEETHVTIDDSPEPRQPQKWYNNNNNDYRPPSVYDTINKEEDGNDDGNVLTGSLESEPALPTVSRGTNKHNLNDQSSSGEILLRESDDAPFGSRSSPSSAQEDDDDESRSHDEGGDHDNVTDWEQVVLKGMQRDRDNEEAEDQVRREVTADGEDDRVDDDDNESVHSDESGDSNNYDQEDFDTSAVQSSPDKSQQARQSFMTYASDSPSPPLHKPKGPIASSNQPLYFDQKLFDDAVDAEITGKPIRRVSFNDTIVSEVFYRDRVTEHEKPDMFYTHEEENRFTLAQSREYEEAERLGMTWLEYMDNRAENEDHFDDLDAEEAVYEFDDDDGF